MDTIKLLGHRIMPLHIEELLNRVDGYIQLQHHSKLVGYTNMHGLYLSLFSDMMKDFYNTVDINYIDGMPIVWLSKLLGYKVNKSHRMTFLDFIDVFLLHCEEKQYRVLWIGGKPASLSRGISSIKSRFVNINLLGIDGYQETDIYNAIIADYKPNIILLGLGMPRQESWALANKGSENFNVAWCIGATIDYISGQVYLPPRWSGKMGLEWFFRLLSEPKRMWYRYFIEPLVVLLYFGFSLLKKSN